MSITANARIGEHVIINTGVTVDHDCVIVNFAHVAPEAHLAGNVRVGKLVHIGIGACVIQGIEVGRNSRVGAGATVIDDIPDNVLAVGVPAQAKG